MNLKLKFALLFSLIVTVILISSVSVIYYLYANTRTEDYNKRLWAEAVQNYQLFYGVDDMDKKILHEIDNYSPGNLIELNTVIIDKSYHIVFTNPETLQYKIDYNLLNTIRNKREFYFSQDDREAVGIYFSDARHECFVITSANDRYGKRRLERLQLISGFVVLGAFVLTCIAALIFVNQITKPLTRLGNQMQRINENNLTERVTIGSGSEELVQIASNFNDMLKRLEAGFEFQKSFVHHASHELRTPLANMLAQTEAALRRDITVEEAKDVLLSLREDQQELIELTNSLLLLSQYEKISYSVDWPRVRLDEILYDTIALVKRIYPAINVSLEFAYLPENDLYLSIQGNDALLRSAFRNLIKNAFQYSDDKNVSIIIEADRDVINIHFVNKGKVLAQNEQERLFIPFFRGENAMRKRGFGLGLSIVKRIILLHKGTVSYTVEADDENRFTVSFGKQA